MLLCCQAGRLWCSQVSQVPLCLPCTGWPPNHHDVMITFQLCDSDSVAEVALGGTLLHRQASAYQSMSRCIACTVLRQGARLWHQGQQCCLQPQIIKDCAVLHT